MSRNAPLACRHCQASQSRTDNFQQLSPGWLSISARIYRMSSRLISRPRYQNWLIQQQHERVFLGTQKKGKMRLYATAFTRRHIGAARTRQHRRRPSATAPHKPPAPWPGNSIPATTEIFRGKDAFAPPSSLARHTQVRVSMSLCDFGK